MKTDSIKKRGKFERSPRERALNDLNTRTDWNNPARVSDLFPAGKSFPSEDSSVKPLLTPLRIGLYEEKQKAFFLASILNNSHLFDKCHFNATRKLLFFFNFLSNPACDNRDVFV